MEEDSKSSEAGSSYFGSGNICSQIQYCQALQLKIYIKTHNLVYFRRSFIINSTKNVFNLEKHSLEIFFSTTDQNMWVDVYIHECGCSYSSTYTQF